MNNKKTMLKLFIVVAGLLLVIPTTHAGQFCVADTDGDCRVTLNDIENLREEFLSTECEACSPPYPAPVEKTGQTISYATGDDGDWQKGVASPNPRFTDNLNGTVTDNLTGLIWLKDAHCALTIGHDPAASVTCTMTWQNALDFVAGINDGTYSACGAGYTDWRLPHKRELFSLVHDGYYNPALSNTDGTGQCTEGDPFTNVQFYHCYWSSTSYAGDPINVWGVFMGDGNLAYDSKSALCCIWPVRGGHQKEQKCKHQQVL